MIDPEDAAVLEAVADACKALKNFWKKAEFPDGIRPDLTPLMASLRVLVAVRKDTGGPSWVELISRDLLKVATQTDGERLERDLVALSGTLLAWLKQKRRERHKRGSE
jgi:hypothetical protein